jgi:hypothetical protein
MPLATFPNYPVVRNVLDYGAKGDGSTDDSAAIARAMAFGDRCEKSSEKNYEFNCTNQYTSTKGAVVYFPWGEKGVYVVKRPIVLYYLTSMAGNPARMPTIRAHKNFKGIALIDTNVYIPGISTPEGDGINWWVLGLGLLHYFYSID